MAIDLAQASPRGLPRRAFLVMPGVFAGWLLAVHRPARALPDAAENGRGPFVDLALYSADGRGHGTRMVRKLLLADSAWRTQLSADEFAVTRRGATEPPFTGQYWHNRARGFYCCVCCGTALFSSRTQFDAGEGWPSFSAPLAQANIASRRDSSLGVTREEVLCRKCDAHLGHVFSDGPAPAGLRYCINSVALRFIPTPS